MAGTPYVCAIGTIVLFLSYYCFFCVGPPSCFGPIGEWCMYIVGALLMWFGANTLVVGVSMYLQTPGVFGKDRTTGHIPLWSRILHAPWHTLVRTMIWGKRRRVSRFNPPVPVLSHIKTTKFWLGGWPDNRTTSSMPECPWDAIIDVTAEMPLQYTKVLKNNKYRSYPTVDATPVSIEYLNDAAEFAIDHFDNKGKMILVHCAFGIGRSSMTLCACMVAIGTVKTWQDAVPILQKSRSIVRINAVMQTRLNLWEEQWKQRPSKKKSKGFFAKKF
mmetsp:Transcript_2061/g.3228  ORF Transcript_2061/g.3228 Transcript_2061/m.3228 type:complete len:274 (-) Transcript_2061:56-877(-)